MPKINVKAYGVALGVYDICDKEEPAREDFNVADIIVHENYDKRKKFFDIALVRLVKPAHFTTICLPVLGNA